MGKQEYRQKLENIEAEISQSQNEEKEFYKYADGKLDELMRIGISSKEIEIIKTEIFQYEKKKEKLYEKLEKKLINLIENAPKNDVEASIVLGKLQYLRGNYADSYNILKDIVEKTDKKDQLCYEYLLNSSICLGYYDDALYYLASLESVLDSCKELFDFAIMHALLCYLNDVETKDPACDYYYMTEELTNLELLEPFREMSACIIDFDIDYAIRLCAQRCKLTRQNKHESKFSTLLKLLSVSKHKKQNDKNKEYETEFNPTLAMTNPKLADNK